MPDINAASCSRADVQTAIDTAVDADRVLVPGGNCTWSSQVIIPDTKGIALVGAGIDVTIITDNLLTADVLELNMVAGNSLTSVNGFTFDQNGISKSQGTIAFRGSGGQDRFRIHDLKLTNLRSRGIRYNGSGNELYGLIDNCILEAPFDASVQSISLFGGGGGGDRGQFAFPFGLGTGNFIFVEDCTFNNTFRNDTSMDSFSGARYVFRHNTINGANIGHHGADSGNRAGIHSFEIYENTFDNQGANLARAFFFRSGSGVVYNNTVTGNYTLSSALSVSNFRSRPQNFPPWGSCDGTSIWDENQVGQSGYACLDQIGHIFGVTSGGSNTLEGLYEWSNTLNGSNIDFNVTENDPDIDNHLQEGRDFFSDTVKPGYVAFTYPHPLQGIAAAAQFRGVHYGTQPF